MFGNQNILYLCCLCFSLQPSLISFTISFSASRSTRSRHNISVDTLSLDCLLKHLSCANIGCICRKSHSTTFSTSGSSSTAKIAGFISVHIQQQLHPHIWYPNKNITNHFCDILGRGNCSPIFLCVLSVNTFITYLVYELVMVCHERWSNWIHLSTQILMENLLKTQT